MYGRVHEVSEVVFQANLLLGGLHANFLLLRVLPLVFCVRGSGKEEEYLCYQKPNRTDRAVHHNMGFDPSQIHR